MAKNKNTRKKISPLETAIVRAERQIKAAQSKGMGLLYVKGDVQPQLLPLVMRHFLNQEDIEKIINPDSFPHSIHSIKQGAAFSGRDFKRDSLWKAASLYNDREKITSFLKLKEIFERFVISSEYKDAEKVLNQIHKEFGYSIWYIQNKIMLIDSMKGLDAQQKFASEIYTDQKNSYDILLLTYFFSRRAEPNLSVQRVNEIVDETLISHGVPDRDRAYFKFHVFPFQEILKQEQVESILSRESNSPIIDKYLTLCRLLAHIHSWPQHKNLKLSSKLTVQELASWSTDLLIENLEYIFSDKRYPELDLFANEVLTAFDSYTIGQYQAAVNSFNELLQEHPDYAELYEASVKAEAHIVKRNANDNLKDKIINLMQDVFSKTNSYDVAVEALHKIIMIHASHSWSIHLLSFLKRDGRRLWREELHPQIIQSGLCSRMFNPWQAEIFSCMGKGKFFIEHYNSLHPNSPTLHLQNLHGIAVADVKKILENFGLPEGRKNKYLCLKYIEKGEYKAAIDILERDILNSDDPMYYDTLRYLTVCYIKVKDAKKCLDLIMEAYLRNTSAYKVLPVVDLIHLIESEKRKDLYCDISWPIINEIFYRHFDGNEEARSNSYQYFLEGLGLDKPSEIDKPTDPFESKKLIFFLKNICIQQVMDSSLAFKNAEEIAQERISICQILGNLDTDNSAEYIAELKNITEYITINKLSRQVEQSKIYADTEGIRSKLGRAFEENYKRYLHLKRNPQLELPALDLIEQLLKQFIDKGDVRVFTVPTSEKSHIMQSILQEITNQFISASDFGLEAYISTKIRHGTLSGQVRSTLAAQHLVATRIAGTEKKYKNLTYWESRISDPVTSNRIQALLKNFTEQLDKLVDEINKEWLQIKRKEKDAGLFDYGPENLKALNASVVKKIELHTPYEEFLNIVFAELWTITEKNLWNIRKQLEEKFEPQVITLLAQLKEDAMVAMNNYDSCGFRSAVTVATTEMQNSIDRIIDWFRISKSQESPDIKLQIALTIGLNSINSYFPQYPLDPDTDFPNEALLIKGKTLTFFTDIFFILFQNAKAHSEVEDRAPNMKISISQDADEITMVVSNELGSGANIEEITQKTKEIIKSFDTSGRLELVQKEGGTGLVKLWKIFKMDLKCNPKISTKVEAGMFEIELKFNGLGMLA